MATVTNTRETFESAKAAQDIARRFIDESAGFGRSYYSVWASSAQAILRAGFDLQNAMIQASWSVFDASCQATRTWYDQTSDATRKGQDATSKLVNSGLEVMESLMPKARV